MGISTHSLKATTLSWLAKAGVSEEKRRLLGYHVMPGTKTLLHYSRDALASPLRALSTVLGMIKDRQFFPDSSRSGYFLNPENHESTMPTLNKVGAKVPLESDDDVSQSSDSSSSQALSDEEQFERACESLSGISKK